MTVLDKTSFFLPLEEVVRQVIIHDTYVALPEFEATLVHICLYLIKLCRQQAESLIDLMDILFRLLKEPPSIFQSRQLRAGIQQTSVKQVRKDFVEVVLILVLLLYFLADIVQTKLIIDILKEQIAAIVAALLVLFSQSRWGILNYHFSGILFFRGRQLSYIFLSLAYRYTVISVSSA